MAGLVRGVRRLSMLTHVHGRVAKVSTRFLSTDQHGENGTKSTIEEEETSSAGFPSASNSVDR